MVLRMKNFNILGVHWKIWLLGGGGRVSQKSVGVLPKTGALGQFADLRWGLGKKEEGGSVDTLMHTMASNFKFARDFWFPDDMLGT